MERGSGAQLTIIFVRTDNPDMADDTLVPVAVVSRRDAAAALLDPLKARILALAVEPASATELARRLDLPRQRVHYHVRELERVGLLVAAGRRRRRNLIEQRFAATARGYVLAPALLGPLAADWRAIEDPSSAGYLLALLEQVRDDVGRAASGAEEGQGLSAITLKAQFRFETDAQRSAFAAAVREALVAAIARQSSPDRREDGRPGPGRPHRLVLACYPVAAAGEEPRGRPARRGEGGKP
jgi:DNA-binding transcriptional ArsR family regulator